MAFFSIVKNFGDKYECYYIKSDMNSMNLTTEQLEDKKDIDLSFLLDGEYQNKNLNFKNSNICKENSANSVSLDAEITEASLKKDENIFFDLNTNFICFITSFECYNRFFKEFFSRKTNVIPNEEVFCIENSFPINSEFFENILRYFSINGIHLEIVQTSIPYNALFPVNIDVELLKDSLIVKKVCKREFTLQNNYNLKKFESHLLLKSQFLDTIDHTFTNIGKTILEYSLFSNLKITKIIEIYLEDLFNLLDSNEKSLNNAKKSLDCLFRIMPDHDFLTLTGLFKKLKDLSFLTHTQEKIKFESINKTFSESAIGFSASVDFNNKKSIYSKPSLEEITIKNYKRNIIRVQNILENVEVFNCIIDIMSKYNCFFLKDNCMHQNGKNEFDQHKLTNQSVITLQSTSVYLNPSDIINAQKKSKNISFSDHNTFYNTNIKMNITDSKDSSGEEFHLIKKGSDINSEKNSDLFKSINRIDESTNTAIPKILTHLSAIKEKAKSLGIKTDFQEFSIDSQEVISLCDPRCFVVSNGYDQYLDLSRSMYKERMHELKSEISKILIEKTSKIIEMKTHFTNEFEYCFKVSQNQLKSFLLRFEKEQRNGSTNVGRLNSQVDSMNKADVKDDDLKKHTISNNSNNKNSDLWYGLNKNVAAKKTKLDKFNDKNCASEDINSLNTNRKKFSNDHKNQRKVESNDFSSWGKRSSHRDHSLVYENSSLYEKVKDRPGHKYHNRFFEKIKVLNGLFIFKETENYYLLMNNKILDLNNTLKEIRNQIYEIEGRVCKAYLQSIHKYNNSLLGLEKLVGILDYLNNIRLFQDSNKSEYCNEPLKTTRNILEDVADTSLKSRSIFLTGCKNLLLNKEINTAITMDYKFTDHEVHLITGENMMGKTSYVRNLCHSVLLTKLGYRKNTSTSSVPLFDQIFYISSVEDLNYFFEVFNSSHLIKSSEYSSYTSKYNEDSCRNINQQIDINDSLNSIFYRDFNSIYKDKYIPENYKEDVDLNNYNNNVYKLRNYNLRTEINDDQNLKNKIKNYTISCDHSLVEKLSNKKNSQEAKICNSLENVSKTRNSNIIKYNMKTRTLISPLRLVIVDEIKCSVSLQIKFIEFTQKAKIMTLFVTHNAEVVEFSKKNNYKIYSMKDFKLNEGFKQNSNATELAKSFIPELFSK